MSTPNTPNTPPTIPIKEQPTNDKKGSGCFLKIFIGCVVLLVSLLVAAWVTLMHTSVPLRSVAAAMEAAGKDSQLKITGVSGTLSSGLSFEQMKWDDGELADVRVRYSGIMDIIRKKHLIIHEIHVGKALINFTSNANYKPDNSSSESDEGWSTDRGESDEWPLELFQIDSLTLADIVIKDRTTGFSLSIPALEWTGFKAENGEIDFGKFSAEMGAETDYLTLVTTDAPDTKYKTRIDCSLMPKMHTLIRKPIRIVTDLGQEDGSVICHLQAFDDALEIIANPDGSAQFNFRELNLADYLDGPLPQSLTLEVVTLATEETGTELFDVRGGEFQLGLRKFQIQPEKWDLPQLIPPHSTFVSLSSDAEPQFRYAIEESEKSGQITQRLSATPALSPEDTLAELFHGKRFSELSPAEQKKLTADLSWFSIAQPE
jgi:hypothetical protein